MVQRLRTEPVDIVVGEKFSAEATPRIVAADAIPDDAMGLDIGPGSVKRFSELMATRKFEKCRLTGGARALAGISLRPRPPSDTYRGGYPYRDD